MKNKSDNILEGFFVSFFAGLVTIWLYEEQKKNHKRINELRQRLNQGLYLDKANIENDWQTVVEDIAFSYEEAVFVTRRFIKSNKNTEKE